jgi:Tol biopolymer transport system component
MRLHPLAAVALLALAGCGYRDTTLVNPPLSSSPADFMLYVQGASQGHSARQIKQVPFGTPAPGWSTLYTVVDGPGGSMLKALDVKSGAVLHEARLDTKYELPTRGYAGKPGGLSENGQWLVLGHRESGRSSFLVMGTDFTSAPRRADLKGDFEFDAVTNDGRRLYLVEYTSADHVLYQVRRYDLASGYLDPRVVVDKTSGALAMSGVRLTSLASRGGQYVYSLYVNGRRGPFIHALDTANGFATCVFLPRATSTRDQEQRWAEVISPDGQTLYAVNGSLGLITKLDISGSFAKILRTSTFETIRAASRPAVSDAWVSAEGRTLFTTADRGVIAIDTDSLGATARYLTDSTVDELALSPDGGWLFAIDGALGKVYELNAATGGLSQQITGLAMPVHIVGVQHL